MKKKKILNRVSIVPITEQGDKIIGTATSYYKIYFEHSNTISYKTSISTINNGLTTTREIIDSHIKKYDKVWQELA